MLVLLFEGGYEFLFMVDTYQQKRLKKKKSTKMEDCYILHIFPHLRKKKEKNLTHMYSEKKTGNELSIINQVKICIKSTKRNKQGLTLAQL